MSRRLALRRALAPSLALALLLVGCDTPPAATTEWRDPSPHVARQLRVDPATELETLDWGGRGATIVLLSGLGNTAHVFDDLAPQLTDSFRVLGITRRGFGASSQPPATDVQALVADIAAVLDSIGVRRAILVGHSIAGDELSGFAAAHPDRSAALVYLDAAYDRTGLAPLFRATPIPPPPPMTAADSASPASVRGYTNRIYGLELPEAEIRATSRFDSTGRFVASVTPDSLAAGIIEHLLSPPYERIRVPALGIYAVADSVGTILPYFASLDSAGREAANRTFTGFQSLTRASIDQFRRELAGSEVVELRGANHYVFMSHERETLGALRSFLSRRLPAGRPE